MGDRIVVVGDINDIERLANKLGNSMKRLNEPNIITIFVGILFGIIVGSINVGFGMKLGLVSGPLVVAILLSRFGYKFKLVTYTSSSASLMLRELGICLFLASVGISSGAGFAETVFNSTWYVVGDLGVHHHFRSAGGGGLHCPWGVQDQFPVYHGYVFGRLH